ncbi:hypothetical protein SASPL_122140 [Salvia splendens]|uniref:Fatty acyl-CoA reductase n=1 Tax=Salvia splendens TaxID=180675 RepID=A0A8X8XNR5_SALSN|nr:hypothetical protein SASPL_122140 [Salvia splendens]
MELGSILQFLEHRSILVTGATGFLAKIFTEKILRVQPNVKKLYLLLRASDTNSAMLRFNNEIMGKELFNVLKEKNGANLSTLIEEKNLGVKDLSLLEEMLTEIDVVVNLAANTNFDERYDVSLGLNTHGAIHVLNFSKKMKKLKIMVHVSTAYVSGEREGLIMENPCVMGETLNGTHGLDIDVETKLIEETLKQLDNFDEDSIKSAMIDLGLQSLAVGYGKGKITCFLGDPTIVVDVNIYHIGSSVSNPVLYAWLQSYGQRHFTLHPWIDRNGSPVFVGKGLQILNTVCCHYFQKTYLEQCRKIKFVLRLIDLYAPYLFFKAFYDDMNTEKLRRATDKSGVETEMFYFDPKIINWDDYFMNTHIPGIVQRVFRN